MFSGAELHVYTNHHNFTCHNLTTQCVLHWSLHIEEYNPTFNFIPGKDNMLADSFYLSLIQTDSSRDIYPNNKIEINNNDHDDLLSVSKTFILEENESLLECYFIFILT